MARLVLDDFLSFAHFFMSFLQVLALKVINEIQPRNNTDLCGGLIRGIEVMSAARVGDVFKPRLPSAAFAN